MKGPLEFISRDRRKPLFLAFLAWTLGLFLLMQVLNRPLVVPAAPAGIVSLELARTPGRAFSILTAWGAGQAPEIPFRPNVALLFAAFGLGFDYLFMPSYAATLALGVMLAAGRHTGRPVALGGWLGWGSMATAAFDAVENVALWMILQGQVTSLWSQLAFACAVVKFGLIALGVLYAGTAATLPRSTELVPVR